MSIARARVILMVAATFTVSLVGLAFMPFVEGPVPARTGGFGEMTCLECHWDNPLNDPQGRLALSGTPTAYMPGARYSIIVDLTRPGLVFGGFQLSARFDGGSSAGTNAGVLRPVDELTERVADETGRITYVQHTKAGSTGVKPGAARWTVERTAPAGDAPVIFHAAGNAANGDASPLGDFIYTTTASSRATGEAVK